MKNVILIATLLLLGSCSKSNQPSNKAVNEPEFSSIIELSAITLNSKLIDGVNSIPSSSLDFASLEKDQVVSQEIIIVNKQLAPLVITSEDIITNDLAPFEIVSNGCIASISRNRSCKIVIKLSNPIVLSESVQLNKSISIKGAQITLTGEQKLYIEPTTPIVGITVSPLSLNFGTLKAGESKELSVLINNKSTGIQTVEIPSITNNKIQMTNTCSATLTRNRSCSVKFKYTAVEDESVTNENIIALFRNPIVYSVSVASPTVEEPEVLAINPSIESSSISLNEPSNQSGTISFTNKGTLPLPSPVTAIASHVGITINSVSCSTGLSRNRVCAVSYAINSSLLPGGISSQTIKIQSGSLASSTYSLNVNITKNSTACLESDVALNNWDLTGMQTISGMKTGEDVSNCHVASCVDGSSPSIAFRQCTQNVAVCNLPNAVGSMTYNPALDNYGSCVLSACENPTYQSVAANNESCIDKPISNATAYFDNANTNVLVNDLKASADNAQFIGFFTSNTCSTQIGNYISLNPNITYPQTLTTGDGVKSVYVKFQNNSEYSSCITATINMKTTPPVASIAFVDEFDSSINSNSVFGLAYTSLKTRSPKFQVTTNDEISSCTIEVMAQGSIVSSTTQSGAACLSGQVTTISPVLPATTEAFILRMRFKDSLGNETANINKTFQLRELKTRGDHFTVIPSFVGIFSETVFKDANIWVFKTTNNKVQSILSNGTVVSNALTISQVSPAVTYNESDTYAYFQGNLHNIYRIEKATGVITLALAKYPPGYSFDQTVHHKIIPTYNSVYFFSHSMDGLPYRLEILNRATNAVNFVVAPASGTGTAASGTGSKVLTVNSVIISYTDETLIDGIYMSGADTLVFPCKTQRADTYKTCMVKSAASFSPTKTALPAQTETFVGFDESPRNYTALNSTVYYTAKNTNTTRFMHKLVSTSTPLTVVQTRLTSGYAAGESPNITDIKNFASNIFYVDGTQLYKIDGSNDNSPSFTDSYLTSGTKLRAMKNYHPFTSVSAREHDAFLMYEVDDLFGESTYFIPYYNLNERFKFNDPDDSSAAFVVHDSFSVGTILSDTQLIGKIKAVVTNLYGQASLIDFDVQSRTMKTQNVKSSTNPDSSYYTVSSSMPLAHMNDKIYTAYGTAFGPTTVGHINSNNMNRTIVSEVHKSADGRYYIEFLNSTEKGHLLTGYQYKINSGSYQNFDGVYLPPQSITVIHNSLNDLVLADRKSALESAALSAGYLINNQYQNFTIGTSDGLTDKLIVRSPTGQDIYITDNTLSRFNYTIDFKGDAIVNGTSGDNGIPLQFPMTWDSDYVMNERPIDFNILKFMSSLIIDSAYAQGPPPPDLEDGDPPLGSLADNLMGLPFNPNL